MKKSLKVFALCAAAIAFPQIGFATSLDPFVADAWVKFSPVDEKSSGASLRSAVARVDPTHGERGQFGVASAKSSLEGLSAASSSFVTTGSALEPARPFTAGASARIQAFDLILTDESGSNRTHTDVSLSFLLDGFISIVGIDSRGRSFLSTSLKVNYGLGAAGPGSTAQRKDIGFVRFEDAYQSPQDNPSARVGGIFTGLDVKSSDLIHQNFTTPVFSVPLDTVLSFGLGLIVNSGGTSNDGDQLSTTSDFGNTLTFSPNAFFNLEAGITANSASLGLANNAANTPVSVPLPASIWLMLAAIGTLTWRRADF